MDRAQLALMINRRCRRRRVFNFIALVNLTTFMVNFDRQMSVKATALREGIILNQDPSSVIIEQHQLKQMKTIGTDNGKNNSKLANNSQQPVETNALVSVELQ